MLQSPVSPESPDGRHGTRAFSRIHNYEAGLEVAENQNREKNDLDPVVVLNSPVETDSPLYVTHGRWAEAPQPIDSTSPQAMGNAALESNCAPTVQPDSDASRAEKGSTLAGSDKEEPKRWCGVGGKVLLLIVVLVVLLVGAIIGGAVGGTQAKKSKSSPAPGNSPQASRPSSPDSAPASETTGPHVHFKLQTYDNYDYKGSAQSFDEPGLFKSAWPIYSYIWTPARSGDYLDTSLLRCSVAFCANQTVTGWWGASIKNQPGDPSRNHSSNYIHIACDELNLNPECSGLDNPAVATLATTKDVLSLIPPSSAQDSIGTTSSSSAARVTTTPTPTSKSSTSSSSSFRPKSTSGSGSLSDTISATKTQA